MVLRPIGRTNDKIIPANPFDIDILMGNCVRLAILIAEKRTGGSGKLEIKYIGF